MSSPLPIALLESIGGLEVLAIGAVILMLFGPRRLPEIARTLGRVSARLSQALQDFKNQLIQGAQDSGPTPPDAPPEPDHPIAPDPSAPDAPSYAESESNPDAADRSGPPEGPGGGAVPPAG